MKREIIGEVITIGLISLNKYVVALIIAQANSCLTHNSVVYLSLLDLSLPLPFIEKILLLLQNTTSLYKLSPPINHSIRELSFQKFVLSSIRRCLKI